MLYMKEEGFGSKMKLLRKNKGITQTEMAKLLKTSQAHISRYESGAEQPSSEVVSKVAKYFKVTEEYLTKVEKKSISSDGGGAMTENAETLGDRIKIIRVYSRKSQTEFAKLLSISQSNLSAVELGQLSPNVEVIKQIGLMGFDLKWLLYGESNIEEKPSGIIAGREIKKITKLLEPLSDENVQMIRQCIELMIMRLKE